MKKVLNLIKTRTVKESGITFGGTLINGVLGVIFYVIIARFLGPAGFGIFSVAVATLSLLADLASLGTDTGIVRFVGKYINSDRPKALRFMKLALEIKVLVWIFVLAAGWLVMPTAADLLFAKPELILPLRLAVVGVGGGLLFSFTTNSFQAIQKYWHWSGINVFTNTVRLIGTAALLYFGILDPISGLWVYILVPFLGFVIGLFFLPKFVFAKGERTELKEFFDYNKWVAVFIMIAAVSSRLDTFLTTRLLALSDVGIYSVAVSLSSIVPQIVYALGAVVAPKLASYNSDRKVFTYLKKLQLFVLGLATAGLAVGIPLAYFVIPYFYGPSYLASIPAFTILLFAQAVFLISVPAHTSVFYYFSKPALFVWTSLGNLILIAGVGYLLISRFGYIGAAYSVLAGSVFNFLVPFVWALNRFSKNEN